ncbi:lysozyme inhibitor LprI family protein [Mesoterricola sediminis]|nr:lysozyme inhibitor LprI family protein [Mesoterricola sediminis]
MVMTTSFANAQVPTRREQPSSPMLAAARLPKGWREASQFSYERLNPEAVAREIGKALSEGHQPWRLDRRTVAADCIMEFGIIKAKDVFEVAERLSPGEAPGEYLLNLPEVIAEVRVQDFNQVPIALSLRLIDPCENPQTTIEMRACAWRKYQEADRELNATYKTLLGRLVDQKHRELLIQAQRDWIKVRDSTAEFEAHFYEGGSIKEQIKTAALERITRARTNELRATLKDEFDH